METTAKVLETMRSAGKPVSAGEVATLSGLDRKEVDKAFAQLKNHYRFGTDYDAEIEAAIESVSIDSIKAVLGEILGQNNYIEVVMHP